MHRLILTLLFATTLFSQGKLLNYPKDTIKVFKTKATTGEFAGTASFDSTFSTHGSKADRFYGPISGTADSAAKAHHSIYADTSYYAVGTMYDTLADSAIRAHHAVCADSSGISDSSYGALTARNLNGGTISATTGQFSGTVNVPSITASATASVDSLYSSKGAKAYRFHGPLTGDVTGNVSGSSGSCTGNSNTATSATSATTATTATNLSGGSVSATTINSSSTTTVDSLFTSKGIKAHTLTLAGGAAGTNRASMDSLTSHAIYVYHIFGADAGTIVLENSVYCKSQFTALGVGNLYDYKFSSSSTPSGPTDENGYKGNFAWDTNYIYFKTTNDRWQRAPLLRWSETAPLTDYSSSSTITGWSASGLTKKIFYKKISKTVFAYFTISGTSNASDALFTLPDSCSTDFLAAMTSSLCPALTTDNTTTHTIGSVALTDYRLFQVFKNPERTNFTSSGTKTVSGSFTYEAK